MQNFKRFFSTLTVSLLCLSITVTAQAEGTLNDYEQKLKQTQDEINTKEAEKNSANEAIVKVEKELQSLQQSITASQNNLAELEEKIEDTNKLIEQKKIDIVKLQDKVFQREGIMKDRLVALQHKDPTNIVIETVLNSENIADLLSRIGAVATLLNADNDMLNQQLHDIEQIEIEKKEITKQEESLKEDQKKLADKQAELDKQLADRNKVLADAQKKYESAANGLTAAQQDQSNIQSQMKNFQEKIKKEQAKAKAVAAKLAESKKKHAAVTVAAKPKQEQSRATQEPKPVAAKPKEEQQKSSNNNGKEFYVKSTAYSHEDTASDYTAMGYNIKENPNMKLIAVDPAIIPLGSKVWVEGYGVAIAGDTGGAIKNHKIDVLMPNSKAALAWGVRTVKVRIID
ncbi:3D domain-containing protein [Metabacillus arenae]|uniref:Cell wall-binding protein n=1 Tax=Metabacillus arenae TaxID=2771434 RepID=A0A926NFJ9_9BACI|nr:3D domain-containing protein [Metabacillus arenae]MBD1383377.1 hypothetical protein [Metabacillus arenae]